MPTAIESYLQVLSKDPIKVNDTILYDHTRVFNGNCPGLLISNDLLLSIASETILQLTLFPKC